MFLKKRKIEKMILEKFQDRMHNFSNDCCRLTDKPLYPYKTISNINIEYTLNTQFRGKINSREFYKGMVIKKNRRNLYDFDRHIENSCELCADEFIMLLFKIIVEKYPYKYRTEFETIEEAIKYIDKNDKTDMFIASDYVKEVYDRRMVCVNANHKLIISSELLTKNNFVIDITDSCNSFFIDDIHFTYNKKNDTVIFEAKIVGLDNLYISNSCLVDSNKYVYERVKLLLSKNLSVCFNQEPKYETEVMKIPDLSCCDYTMETMSHVGCYIMSLEIAKHIQDSFDKMDVQTRCQVVISQIALEYRERSPFRVGSLKPIICYTISHI